MDIRNRRPRWTWLQALSFCGALKRRIFRSRCSRKGGCSSDKLATASVLSWDSGFRCMLRRYGTLCQLFVLRFNSRSLVPVSPYFDLGEPSSWVKFVPTMTKLYFLLQGMQELYDQVPSLHRLLYKRLKQGWSTIRLTSRGCLKEIRDWPDFSDEWGVHRDVRWANVAYDHAAGSWFLLDLEAVCGSGQKLKLNFRDWDDTRWTSSGLLGSKIQGEAKKFQQHLHCSGIWMATSSNDGQRKQSLVLLVPFPTDIGSIERATLTGSKCALVTTSYVYKLVDSNIQNLARYRKGSPLGVTNQESMRLTVSMSFARNACAGALSSPRHREIFFSMISGKQTFQFNF
ncbi:hypothetical protein SELMODRAFT_414451 [Selaginella moellendorffii]|uniref:Uncharacterized protein n=1 Tax=Selaginella moellendorffii TaxID=88036 RepID=D8RST8_SELML|nr:hypothetical protein SELMODRAFT_414451 [Selaginella moellendorffii]